MIHTILDHNTLFLKIAYIDNLTNTLKDAAKGEDWDLAYYCCLKGSVSKEMISHLLTQKGIVTFCQSNPTSVWIDRD